MDWKLRARAVVKLDRDDDMFVSGGSGGSDSDIYRKQPKTNRKLGLKFFSEKLLNMSYCQFP